MGFIDSLKSWFQTEAAEARDVLDNTKSRLESDLGRRETELAASPSEKMDMLQEQISAGDESFEALQDKIEGRMAVADAVEELSPVDPDTEDITDGEADGEADGDADNNPDGNDGPAEPT